MCLFICMRRFTPDGVRVKENTLAFVLDSWHNGLRNWKPTLRADEPLYGEEQKDEEQSGWLAVRDFDTTLREAREAGGAALTILLRVWQRTWTPHAHRRGRPHALMPTQACG